MKFRFQLIVLCSCMLAFSSCEEDPIDDIIDTPTKSELITNTWKIVAEMVDPPIMRGGVPVSDTYAQNDPCTHDDEITFSSDHVLTMTVGPVTCSSGTTPYQVAMIADWQFINEEEKVVISNEIYDSSDTVNVKSLTKNRFIITETWHSSSTGLNHTRTTTMEPVE